MPADLAKDTTATPVPDAPGLYSLTLPDSWNWRLPSGGIVMTVALRAIRDAIADPGFHPVSATTIFCAPVPAGPLEVRVEFLRRGNVAVQARASLRATSSAGPDLEVSATFARERRFIEAMGASPPKVPP